MVRFIWLTVILGLGLASWTASLADMEKVVAILASDTPEEFGHTLANAGDVNGDGYEDLVVGNHKKSSQRAYVYFGGPSFDTIPDATLGAPEDIIWFGYNVCGAGDVNGDDTADMMVAAANEDNTKGVILLFHGGSPLDTVPDVVIFENPGDVGFGWAMSYTGDLNGDGYDDVIVGAPETPVEGYGSGKAYIYHGGNPMDTIPDLVLRHNTQWGYFGTEVSALGDVNGDGYPDIGVGHTWWNTYTGRAYLYFGGPDMDRVPEVILSGERAYSHFGTEIAGVDLNNDGHSDIVVGATTFEDGRIYIYRGGPRIPHNPDLIMSGRTKDFEELGRTLTPVGDLDRDGYDDFVSGTFEFRGRVYAYYGGKRVDRDIDLVVPDASGGANNLGRSMAGFDIDNDGHQELMVGSPNENKVYIYRIRHNQFTIVLRPDTREVARGDELGFTATITNNTNEDLNLYFWVDLLDTEGRPFGDAPYLGPTHRMIPAKKTVSRHITMEVGYWDVGPWTCTVKADTTEPVWPYLDFIENDSFEFKIVPYTSSKQPFLRRLFSMR
jgi:hypothetical protein